MIRRLLMLFTIAAALFAAVGASPAGSTGSANYQWIACMEPVEGPCMTEAANGPTVTLEGEGTLSIHPKSVTGGGTFSYPGASGTFTATQLLSFVSYGSLPPPDEALEGGKALIRVHLSTGRDAVLTVTCLVGNPPSGAHEGIELAVQGGPNFTREVEGQTVFIRVP